MNTNRKNKAFWSWNGNMDDDEIRRQIKLFAEQDFGGFFIHARAGLKIPYLGEEWFRKAGIAIECAARNGLEVFLYDENGWPSGFAGGKVVAANASCKAKRVHTVRERIADTDKTKILAAFSTKACLPTDIDQADIAFVCEEDDQYVDLLQPEATDLFIQITHGEYKKRFGKYFGSVIKGIFTDEPQLDGNITYSREFARRYEERYARAYINDMIYYEAGTQEERYAFKKRYYDLLAELFYTNYYKKIGDFCKANGLLFTGHVPCEDGIASQFEKAGDIMRNYTAFGYPGIDFLGRRLISPVAVKGLTSIKNQYGAENVLSETFGCCGWRASVADLKRIWGYQAVLGVNSACLHLSAYSLAGIRKRDYPPTFSYQSDWFEKMHYLNGWMQNVNDFVTRGKQSHDVLVLNPVYECAVADTQQMRQISARFRTLTENLLSLQIGFDYADKTTFSQMRAEGGRLRFGDCSYRIVIVPYVVRLHEEWLSVLAQFRESGGTVLFTDDVPDNLQEADLPYGGVVQNRRDLWRKAFTYLGYVPKVRVARDCDKLLLDYRSDGNTLYITAFNTSENCRAETELIVRNAVGRFYNYDPDTHTRTPVPSVNTTRGAEVRISVDAGRLLTCEFTAEEETPCGKEISYTQRIKSDTCALGANNCLVLDKCAYSFDGKAYSKEDFTSRIQNAIYADEQAKGKDCVYIKFAFSAQAETENAEIYIEEDNVLDVWINGEQASVTDDWFIDKAIKKVVGGHVQKGENQVVLRLRYAYLQDVAYDGRFESVRNRFSYDTPVENIYVVGNFDVASDTRCTGSGIESAGNFVLLPPVKKDFDAELTRQGLPFYRGTVSKRFRLPYGEGKKTIRADFAGVLATVCVNGAEAGYLDSGKHLLDITRFLHKGNNNVTVTVYSGNRNVLGPHHHYRGDPELCGLSSYNGLRGFEDEVVDFSERKDTFVSAYELAEFYLGDLIVETHIDNPTK